MIVGVDVDGILADFNEGYVKLLGSIAPDVKFPPLGDTYPDTWNYHLAAGVSKEQNKQSWDYIKNSETFWFDLNPYHNTVSFLVWLKGFSRRHDVYFITNRMGGNAKFQTERWLHKAGFGEPTVLLSATKALACNAVEIDYYVDDKNENVRDVAQNAPKTKCYMLQRPWNEQINNVPRIESLHDFQNVLTLATLKGK